MVDNQRFIGNLDMLYNKKSTVIIRTHQSAQQIICNVLPFSQYTVTQYLANMQWPTIPLHTQFIVNILTYQSPSINKTWANQSMHWYYGMVGHCIMAKYWVTIYIHTYIHTCMHTYIHTYIHTYKHTYIHTYIDTYIHTYIHIYIHMCIHTYIHTYIYTYIHTYIYNGDTITQTIYYMYYQTTVHIWRNTPLNQYIIAYLSDPPVHIERGTLLSQYTSNIDAGIQH